MSGETQNNAQGIHNKAATNSYLELRKAKIERNAKVLASLGLSESTPKKHVNNKKSKSGAVKTLEVRTRRSSRLRNITGDDLQSQTASDTSVKQADATTDLIEVNKPRRIQKRPREESTPRTYVQSEAKPGTTRATNIDIKQTLYGHFDYPVFVGRRLASTGKAAVVEHANFMCGNEPGIGFNKYSGVCEFQNEALFLWVNIGVPDADVRNEFLNGGKQITWFGGSRMREESPVIQKLISIGKKASSGNLPDSCGIVLWCRMHNKTSKGIFEPYACLGRLGYHAHEAGSPVKFIWDLLDADILMNTSEGNKGKASLFQQIIERTQH